MFSRKYGFAHTPHIYAGHGHGIASTLKEDMEHIGAKHHHIRMRIHGHYGSKELF